MKKKVIFTESIDKSMQSFALVVSFIIIGCFLEFNVLYFGYATTFIKWTFIIFGVLGLLTESKKYMEKFEVIGLDNINAGIFFLVIVNYGYAYFYPIFEANRIQIISTILSVIYSFLLVIAIYGLALGIIQLFYSISQRFKKGLKAFILSSVAALSSFASFLLIILQIFDVINII